MTLRTGLWALTALTSGGLAFFIGYAVSSATGVEPGYFEAAETGGYGVAEEGPAGAGVNEDFQKYYDDLAK